MAKISHYYEMGRCTVLKKGRFGLRLVTCLISRRAAGAEPVIQKGLTSVVSQEHALNKVRSMTRG